MLKELPCTPPLRDPPAHSTPAPAPDRAQQAIGQIAGGTLPRLHRRLPPALKLDFCCGGPDRAAAGLCQQGSGAGRGCSLELATLDRPPRSPRPSQQPADMIDHIPDALPRGAPRAAARADPYGPACGGGAPRTTLRFLTAWRGTLKSLEVELLEHMEKEEQVLFPAIKGRCPPGSGADRRDARGAHRPRPVA